MAAAVIIIERSRRAGDGYIKQEVRLGPAL